MSNTKIFGANHGIATSNVIPDNNSTALDIESTDAKDYITANTTDGSESITLGQATKITGPGGTTGFSIPATNCALLVENSTGDSNTACTIDINSDGANGAQIRFREADTEYSSIVGTDASFLIKTESGNKPIVLVPHGTGNVGIGESDPDSHWTIANSLVVKDSVNAGLTLCAGSSSNSNTIAFADGANVDGDNTGGMIQYIHNGDYTRLYSKYNGESPRQDDAGEHVMRYNEYGMGKMRYSTAYDATARDSVTNTSRPVYLATTSSTNDTLVIDYEHGSVGEVTLTNNITAIKVYNAPRHGSAQTMTVKIKQASSAVTLSYSSVTVYWNTSSTAAGNLLWSGGAAHVLSTGNNQIDIVQFTCLPHGNANRDIYASVIGQNFS